MQAHDQLRTARKLSGRRIAVYGASALDGQFAIVTGASRGIGGAIAGLLAEQGASICLVGRDLTQLEATRGALAKSGAEVEIDVGDLSDDAQLGQLSGRLAQAHHRVDIVVHAAGIVSPASLLSTSLRDFDRQFRTNVRAPFVLTQALLPSVIRARGQVVFINSSVGLHGRENLSAYAGTKHALKAIADTLRMEVNHLGVRVLSVFAGATATAMQQVLCEFAGVPYVPEDLLQPLDIATAVVQALSLPRTAELTDLHIRPMLKA